MPYEAKHVLVTGGLGFMGSTTINHLCMKYPHITFINVDRMDYCSSIKNVLDHKNYKFYRGDIADVELISKILREHTIETVLHLAAATHVDLSFSNSIDFTETNVLGTHRLLEACKQYGGIQRFIHVSTDEVYGSVLSGQTSSGSTSILNPTNPYAASKAAAEHILNAYYHSFRVPAIVIRSNNTYGPKQHPDKLIAKFIVHLFRGQKCPIHGRGEARRNFVYVDDFARAVEMVLLNGSIGEIYDVGSENNEFSVMDVLRILIRELQLSGKEDQYYEFVPDRQFQDHRYAVDCKELKALGWKEEVSFAQGIRETVKWYKDLFLHKTDLSIYWPSFGAKKTMLIYGSRGSVGRDFIQYMEHHHQNKNVWNIIQSDARLDGNLKAIEDELVKLKPNVVFCTVGRTGKRCEEQVNENVRDNLYAPLRLAKLCHKHRLYMVYIGTGCIFQDDQMTTLFTGNAYSTVKGYTDRLMNELYGDVVLNVRIRMPFFYHYVDNERDYLNKLNRYDDVVMDVPNSFSVMRTLWPVLIGMMERQVKGTINLCNPGPMTNREILSIFHPEKKKNNITIDELTTRLGTARCFYVLSHSYDGVPMIRDALMEESRIRNQGRRNAVNVSVES